MAEPDPTLALMTTFQHHIDDMRNLIMCKICLKPLYEPFIIACGHTYCYGCLRSWFCGLDSRRRKKNCPDCRSEVMQAPSANYILRDLVHMFIGRAELLPEDETVDEHVAGRIAEAELLATDKDGPGIFQGVFERATYPFGEVGPLRDIADGVLRCPQCYWELEDGSCNQCGFELDDDEEYPFSDDDESLTNDEQSIASDEISDGSGYDSDDLGHHFYAAGSLADDIDPTTSELEYGNEMDEFLDDLYEDEPEELDEDNMGVPGVPGVMRVQARWRGRPYRIPDDDEDDSQADEEEEEESDGILTSNWPRGPVHSSSISDDENDSQDQQTNYDESDESRSATPVPKSIVPRRRNIVISDEDEDDEDDIDTESQTEGRSQAGDDTRTENDDSDSDDTTIPPQSSTFRRQRLDDHRKRRRAPPARNTRPAVSRRVY